MNLNLQSFILARWSCVQTYLKQLITILMIWILFTETNIPLTWLRDIAENYPQTARLPVVCVQTTASCRKVNRLIGRMTSLLNGGHVRLGVNFMSWSNFWVLVWLSLPWRDFITLSDIIRICCHVLSDVITLWWSRESCYDFFLRLGWNFRLGGILFVLVSFYTLVQLTESWYNFSSFWTQFSF